MFIDSSWRGGTPCMKKKAIIKDQEYTLLEILPSLDGGPAQILCIDSDDHRAICSESLWCANEANDECSASIDTHSSAQDKINFFLALFKGRQDVYARRYYSTKTGKSGYTPVCRNEWAPGLCDKKKFKCPDCPSRAFAPLTAAAVKAHLIGRDPLCRDVAGLYPMLEDNTTWILVADFDEEHWQLDVAAFCKCCQELELTPAVERSRSGNGAHIWFFFSEPVPAADARRLGTGLLTRTMSQRHELSFASYDRLFPSQDTVPKGGFGNLIALPFQGQAQKEGNSLFIDEHLVPYPDQWAYLSTLPKITHDQLDSCLQLLSRENEIGEFADPAEKTAPWQHKRSKRKLSHEDFPIQVSITLSNLIYIEKEGLSQAALNTIKRMAAFPNPEFRSKQAMRIPVYGIPRILNCGYEDDDYIGLPRGCLDGLLALLEQYEVPMILNDLRCVGRSIDVAFHGTLRAEQEPAAEAMVAADMGVLSATTAFGKTVIGAYLIGKRKTNTLILVHSSALLEQWKSSLEQFLDIHESLPEPPKKRGRRKKLHLIGQIGSGKNTRSGIIDIAIMQSLFEGEEKTVKPFVAEYGMVIVDECHHVAAFTFETVLKAVEAKYVYGLSATPVRKDGHHPIIFMQCGPVRYLVDAKSQAEKQEFRHVVIPRFTRMRLPDADSIQDMYAGMVENENRNDLLISDTLTLVQEGRTPILLTERKEHAAKLAGYLADKVKNVFLLIGSDRQKEKREKLAALQNVPSDEDLVVVATGKYIGEGFDSPRLDTLLLAMPISWKGTLAQYAGRLHRNYEGKHEVRIYDFADLHVPTLERMYHKRLKGYGELGYQVRFGASDAPVSSVYDGRAWMEPFSQDLMNATKRVVIVSPGLQKGRLQKTLFFLQELQVSGTEIIIHTKTASSYNSKYQKSVQDAITLMDQHGIAVHTHTQLQQRYAIIDHKIVWYGSVDFLSYPRNESVALRFVNADIAGALSALSDESECEQLMITDSDI